MRVMDESPATPACQFSLRAMLMAVALLTVFLAGIRYPSVASFLFTLLATLLVTGYAARLAVKQIGHRRVFWSVFALVTLFGSSLSLTTKTPIGQTPIVQVMWWQLTKSSARWFSFSAACYQGTFALGVTLVAGLVAGGLALRIAKFQRRPAEAES